MPISRFSNPFRRSSKTNRLYEDDELGTFKNLRLNANAIPEPNVGYTEDLNLPPLKGNSDFARKIRSQGTWDTRHGNFLAPLAADKELEYPLNLHDYTAKFDTTKLLEPHNLIAPNLPAKIKSPDFEKFIKKYPNFIKFKKEYSNFDKFENLVSRHPKSNFISREVLPDFKKEHSDFEKFENTTSRKPASNFISREVLPDFEKFENVISRKPAPDFISREVLPDFKSESQELQEQQRLNKIDQFFNRINQKQDIRAFRNKKQVLDNLKSNNQKYKELELQQQAEALEASLKDKYESKVERKISNSKAEQFRNNRLKMLALQQFKNNKTEKDEINQSVLSKALSKYNKLKTRENKIYYNPAEALPAEALETMVSSPASNIFHKIDQQTSLYKYIHDALGNPHDTRGLLDEIIEAKHENEPIRNQALAQLNIVNNIADKREKKVLDIQTIPDNHFVDYEQSVLLEKALEAMQSAVNSGNHIRLTGAKTDFNNVYSSIYKNKALSKEFWNSVSNNILPRANALFVSELRTPWSAAKILKPGDPGPIYFRVPKI